MRARRRQRVVRMGYRLSTRADHDIRGIALFGTERFGIEQAARYHTELESVFEMLARHPMLAREQVFRPPVRIHVHRSHAVVYLIEGDDVFIVRVLHASQDWRRHL